MRHRGRYLWKDDTIFEIKISSGCTNACSYCASRLGIGNYRSKPLGKIRKELELGISLGYQRFLFMGDELGNYGTDIGTDLIALLQMCLQYGKEYQFGIRYIHPDAFIALYPRLQPYFDHLFFLCVSLQSASGRVLKQMNRTDRIAEITPLLQTIHSVYPNIYLHTQIIVGFPNETEEDFAQTMAFLKRCPFDYIRFNPFSARKGTAAYSYPLVYSEQTLQTRLQTMREFCQYNRYERLYHRYNQLIQEHEKRHA